MRVENITVKGNYKHTGWAVAKDPKTIKNDKGEQEIVNGMMYLFFEKDNKLYYTLNTLVKGFKTDLQFGVFQDYFNPNFIGREFFIDIVIEMVGEEEIELVDISLLDIIQNNSFISNKNDE